MDPAVADRLARRYPQRRVPRRVAVIAVLAVAVVAVTWVVLTGLRFASPSVSGRVDTWQIRSDTEADFVITMERTEPTTTMVCRVIAQADDFERVGELDVTVAPGPETRVVVEDSLRTFRRATSVSLDACRAG